MPQSNKEASPEQEEKKKPNYLVIGLFATLAIIVFLALFGFLDRDSEATKSSVSGTINFNGIKPQEKANEVASIAIMQRVAGSQEAFADTGVEVPVQDNAQWSWDNAEEGVTYEIMADLTIEGQKLKASNELVTTAPSSGQVLTFNVTIDDIPNHIIEESKVSVSGVVKLNGYVPSGSNVVVLEKEVSEREYGIAVEGLSATDGVRWEWKEALPGVEYDFKAVLALNNDNIGESDALRATAPASGEVLIVESAAQPPEEPKVSSIEGSIQLNGAVGQDWEVRIVQRDLGDTEFALVQVVPAVNGSTWRWNNALEGVKYEVTAELYDRNDNKISTGNTLTLTAPAYDELIIIDTKQTLNPPKDAPRYSCKEELDNDQWEAEITYPRIEGSKIYYQEVGTKEGGSDLHKDVVQNSNPNEDTKVKVNVESGSNNYARYAYSYCTSCDVYDTQNWSAFSPTLKFSCGDEEGSE